MKKLLISLIIVVALSAGLSFEAFSAKVEKIGIVDMQMALRTVKEGKAARGLLEKEFNKKKKELQDEENAIKKLGEEFKKQSLVLSDEARMKKQGELQQRVMRFQEMTGKSQMEIQKKEQDLTLPILQNMRKIISEIAKEKGYTIVLEKDENTVLYSQDEDDITENLIKIYNSRHKG